MDSPKDTSKIEQETEDINATENQKDQEKINNIKTQEKKKYNILRFILL